MEATQLGNFHFHDLRHTGRATARDAARAVEPGAGVEPATY